MRAQVNELANFYEKPNGQKISVAIVEFIMDALSLV